MGLQRQRALGFLQGVRQAWSQLNAITFSALTSACEKGKQWQRALGFLQDMRQAWLQPKRDHLQRADQ